MQAVIRSDGRALKAAVESPGSWPPGFPALAAGTGPLGAAVLACAQLLFECRGLDAVGSERVDVVVCADDRCVSVLVKSTAAKEVG